MKEKQKEKENGGASIDRDVPQLPHSGSRAARDINGGKKQKQKKAHREALP